MIRMNLSMVVLSAFVFSCGLPPEEKAPDQAVAADQLESQSGLSSSSSCSASSDGTTCTIKKCQNQSCTTESFSVSSGRACACSSSSGGGGIVPCPADGNCGPGKRCYNPFGDPLPNRFARCI
jgi:hypothetical protein